MTFSGKDCVCQLCSHTLVKSNEPIKIHGPSRKSGVRLSLSPLFRATRCYSMQSIMQYVCDARLACLTNQVYVRSVVGPVMLIRQLRIMQDKPTHHSFISTYMQRIEDVAYSQYIFLYEHIHISHYIVYILQEDELMIPQQSNGD